MDTYGTLRRTRTAAQPGALRDLRILLDTTHDHFLLHFDNGWLLEILDRRSFSPASLREIREMNSYSANLYDHMGDIWSAVRSLEEFVRFCNRCVAPVLRDELGVSGLTRYRKGSRSDETEVLKGFYAYTFPANLFKLEQKVEELNHQLRLVA